MTKAIIGLVAAVIIGCLGLPILLLSAVMGGGGSGCDTVAAAAPQTSDQPPDIGNWTDGQLHIAATIIDVGVSKGVPQWGWVVAIATAMQESGLRNLPDQGASNDHDSIGVFQQRPSQGWGTVAELAKPAYQAAKFFDKLVHVAGWAAMPLTQAAQAVQISAFPGAYAQWTDDAINLVDRLTSTLTDCASDALASLPANFTLPADTPAPIASAIYWAIGQIGTPYHFGGSCTNPHSGDPDQECDCSSLVQAAYRAAGVTIPRVTTDQVHAGEAVSDPSQLQPGDLIFIPGSEGTMDDPRHVGMYLGQGLIIEAPHTGTRVKLTTLASWRNSIVAVRRIVK